MKQKLKNYLKIGILLFGIPIVIVSCTQDEQLPIEQIQETASNFNYLKRTELPLEVMSNLNSSIGSSSKRGNTFARDVETSFGTILTEIVLLGTDSTGIENYTFKVALDDEDPKTFYNLILRKEIDGSFSPPYLKRYTMDDTFFSGYSSGNSSLDQFVGTVENIAVDDSIDINILLGRQQRFSSPCIEPIFNDGDINNPDDGNTGSAGGGGGGTSGTGTGSTGGSGTGSGNTGGTGSSGSSSCTAIYDMVIVGYAWCDACGDGGSYQAVYQYQIVAWDCPSLNRSSTANRTEGCIGDNGNIGTLGEDIANSISENINDLNLDPCSSQILTELKKLESNDITKIIQRFGTPNSIYNWEIKNETLTSGNIAETDRRNGVEAFDYVTDIDSNYVNQATKNAIARTILHEMLHAYMISHIDDVSTGNTVDVRQFLLLWQYIRNTTSPGGSTQSAQHQYMANRFIPHIKAALKEWDNSTQSEQYYEDLAWGALFETDTFNHFHPVGSASRNRIINTNAAEDTNTNQNGISPKGSPCT